MSTKCVCHRVRKLDQDGWIKIESSTRISYITCLLLHNNEKYLNDKIYERSEYKQAYRRAVKRGYIDKFSTISSESSSTEIKTEEERLDLDSLYKIAILNQNNLIEENIKLRKELNRLRDSSELQEMRLLQEIEALKKQINEMELNFIRTEERMKSQIETLKNVSDDQNSKIERIETENASLLSKYIELAQQFNFISDSCIKSSNDMTDMKSDMSNMAKDIKLLISTLTGANLRTGPIN